MNKKFWIVCCAESEIDEQWDSKDAAIEEAKRIALGAGRRVYVCECIGSAATKQEPVVWTDYNKKG
jgi:hypothetical protein